MFGACEQREKVGLRVEDGQAGGIGGFEGEVIGRQPNFLQKLFNFLALDPHPYADVIYWAADSKQLVIARPDELAKKVLPMLFKHDKVSSFGRQLNIYGFARVYPGRQFKDDQGNILDASVWAHPTLHRLSTPIEVSGVRRRAAPKLFRTRRLANGETIRVKAGPEVARKFREIKEDMATERRIKNGWPAIPIYAAHVPQPEFQGHFDDGTSSSRQEGMSGQLPDAADWDMGGKADWEFPVSTSDQQAEELQEVDMGEGYHAFPLSFNVNSYRPEDTYRPQPLSSIPEGGLLSPDRVFQSHNHHQCPDPQVQHAYQVQTLPTDSYLPAANRPYQSCPASIHTSPVLSPSFLQTPRHFPSSFNCQPTVSDQRHNTLQLRVNTHMPMRIAAPAAVDPFAALPYNVQYDFQATSPFGISPHAGKTQQLGDLFSPQYMQPRKSSADTTPSDGMSREGSVYPEGQSWERTGIIDPRWVSPRGSAWNTPAMTPRSGSPVAQVFPDSQLPRGWPDVVAPMSFGRGMGMPASAPVTGGMGPPPVPWSRPADLQHIG